MATTPRKTPPRTPQQRMAARRDRLRAQGLRPVQHWVPDMRDPKVRADLRRQAKPVKMAVEFWKAPRKGAWKRVTCWHKWLKMTVTTG